MDEFNFIKRVIKTTTLQNFEMAIGDDCSAVDWDSKHLLIQSTDLLVESVHFNLDNISFQDLAYKSLAVNISDIAAMGGRPLWVHLSVAVPPKIDENSLETFFKSFKKEAKQQGVSLLGGDLSKSKNDLLINVCISGTVKKKSVQYRRDFQDADLLCVTGPLGDPALGLFCLENKIEHVHAPALIQRHHRPPIEWEKSQFLAKQKGVHGMLDLSDGLLSDLCHLGAVDYQILVQNLPLSTEALQFCNELQLDPYDFAIAGGEDYRILFGVKEKFYDQVCEAFETKFAEKIFCIGNLASPSEYKKPTFLVRGKSWQPTRQSFSHFSDAND